MVLGVIELLCECFSSVWLGEVDVVLVCVEYLGEVCGGFVVEIVVVFGVGCE